MEPLLHDCLIYCHAHMNDIVKTSTNLACLSDALLTRLAAMYTNAELEAIRDRKDKIQSRLYCKMILSLAEPVPETLRGHYATLATLFKCNKCNKLLGRHIAEQVPCQPSNMRIDRRGNVISTHTKDMSWSLNEYITWLYGELRSWRRVYWRLWADCHFLRCQLCDSYFPAYQGRALPAARHACCGERAYRFETIPRNTGCQFREHVPDERLAADAAVMEVYNNFRDIIAMRPPQLMFPERLTRLVPRESGEDPSGRLQCKEVFWWEGIQLVPPRQPLGLLGKLYTSNTKFNPNARPGSPVLGAARTSVQSIAGNCSSVTCATPEVREIKPKPPVKEECPRKQGAGSGEGVDLSSDSSEQSSDSERSEEDAPRRSRARVRAPPPPPATRNTLVIQNVCFISSFFSRRIVYKYPLPVINEISRFCQITMRQQILCPGLNSSLTSTRASPHVSVQFLHIPISARRGRAQGRVWAATQSARSNQDGQRRFEERAAAHMRAALARRHQRAPRQRSHPGGAYARLEAEWRERHGARGRPAPSARGRPALKYK
ncbi:unnamed protein product [Euphydryas editha]|uniref:SANT and BTB domain-containing protein n=1 Tax=Euphydryas editha TaxID=104508 RepID=A0AAU9U2H5_EUPED|nr:unnamed protein product [Euphydryas editha]